MKKTYLLLTLLCSFLGFSQFNESAPWMEGSLANKSGELTIDEITASFNAYWLNRDKTKRGSGYKPYMRWENHWKNKTNSQGFLITPQEMWDAVAQKKQSKLNRNQNSSQALPTSNWLPLGPFSNATPNSTRARGRVNVVAVDPSNSNTIYFGAPAGGIWKSINAGISWIPLSDELPQIGISGIAIDHTNSNVIYISTGDKDAADTYSIGVLKSTDGGTTWNTTGLTFTNTSTRAGDLILHPTNNQILWCATSVGLYKTSNGGTTWTVVQTGNFAQGSVRLKPGAPSTVYAVSNNKFYRSTDTGATFTNITSGLPISSGRLVLDVTAANSNYIYILSSKTTNTFQGVYRSTNGGTSFTKTSGTTNILESTQAWYDLALAVSSTNAEEIYTGCLNVWKSTNGGVAFTRISEWNVANSVFTHADIHFLQFINNKLYCGSDGGIYVSADNGGSFSDITGEAQITQFYKISVAKQTASKIAGGTQDNGGYAFSGGTWKGYHGGDGMDCAISPTNSDLFYGFLYYGQTMFISNNAGLSLVSSVAGPASETGNWVTPLIANSQGELFSGFTKLFRLDGAAWVQQSVSVVGTGNIDYIAVDPSNDDIMYVSNGSELYKSIDRGINFSLVYITATSITSIDVHSSNSSIVYITTGSTSGVALKSTDGGTVFTDISEGLPAIGKNIIVHQGRNSLNPLYLGNSIGVYYRDDSMLQWEPFDTNLPNVTVSDLEINLEDNILTAATYGRGVWKTAIPAEVPLNDLKIVEILSPVSDISCGGTISPQISVKNNGSNAVSTVNVTYDYNGTPQNYVWNGSIASNATQIISVPSFNIAAKGVYTLNVTTTITGDAYSDNNQLSIPFYVNNTGTVGVVNTFETDADNLLTYTDGSNDTSQWQRGTRVGSVLSTGTNNAYTSNLIGNYPDLKKAYLISQCYNLTNVVNPTIRFKMAFDLEPDWDIVYVEYSTNFGQTWNILGTQGVNWYNSNRTPQTSGTDCYNCPGAQWTGTDSVFKDYSYPLNALAGQANVIFRIVFHSDEGVNQLGVVVDNFVIDGTLATQQFELNNIAIYPNPSKGIFNIAMGNVTPKTIEVFDLTGKIIYSRNEFQNNSSEILIDLSAVSSGIYFVKIASENQSVAKRIIKN